MTRRFHIVDVFATEKYTGNQLAVVTDAADLSTEAMQAIAAEMNYSETTFVTGPPTDGSWPVRIFTPAEEVPFAGHPTLGTAYVIREHLTDGPTDRTTLALAVGDIPVEVRNPSGRDEEETLWMTQQPPTFGERLDRDQLTDVLGLSVRALDDSWPVQVVSTGLPTVIVPLADRDALEAIRLDRPAYDALVEARDAKLVFAFCADPREESNDVAARMFAPYYNVPEDPATGSATGCLAAYLAHHEYFGDSAVEARVEQGYVMGRPSLLELAADASNDEVTVEVGGSVVSVARGDLL